MGIVGVANNRCPRLVRDRAEGPLSAVGPATRTVEGPPPVPGGGPSFAAAQLYQRLVEKDDPLQYECFVDTLEDLPYKDYRYYQRAGGGNEQSFFREIFVVGNGGG